MSVAKQKRRPALRADVVCDDEGWSMLGDVEPDIDRAIRAIVETVDFEPGIVSVSIALSSDAEVADLNGRFRGKPKPTNVLSFPAGAGAEAGHLGDIILALETVRREADEQRIPLSHHVQHLVVHGILHLLGYDHLATAEAERMESLEIKILLKLGIANPYTGALETGTND